MYFEKAKRKAAAVGILAHAARRGRRIRRDDRCCDVCTDVADAIAPAIICHTSGSRFVADIDLPRVPSEDLSNVSSALVRLVSSKTVYSAGRCWSVSAVDPATVAAAARAVKAAIETAVAAGHSVSEHVNLLGY